MIFLIVEGTLIWSLVSHRARRGGPEAAQIRGNTPLELGWTVGAALILVVLTVVTFVYLDDIKNPPPSGPDGLASQAQFASIDQPEPAGGGGPTLNIEVNGQQYLWRYDYPGDEQLFSYYEMVVPTDTTVTLDVTASDVIHSWWIPKLGGKVDGVPGPRERDLVQDPARQGGRLQRPVRRALRRRPRRHARRGARGHARASSRPGPSASAPTSRPPRGARPSSASGASRQEEDGSRWRQHARRRGPEIVMHGLRRAPGRLARVADHDRPQEDRDPLPVRHLPVLHPRRRRGADHAPPAGAAGRHAGRPPRPTTAS